MEYSDEMKVCAYRIVHASYRTNLAYMWSNSIDVVCLDVLSQKLLSLVHPQLVQSSGLGRRIHGLVGRLHDLGGRLHGLGGRFHGPGGRIHGFGGRLHGVGGRLRGL